MKAQQMQWCVFNFLSKPRRSVKPENSHGEKCRGYGPWKDGPWSLSFSLRPFCRAPPKLRTASSARSSSSFKLSLSLSLSLSLATTPNPNPILQTPETPSHGRQGFHFFSILWQHWRSFSREISQIWLQVRKESRICFRLLLYFCDQLEPNSTYSQSMAIS
jgi:hypothetical protein